MGFNSIKVKDVELRNALTVGHTAQPAPIPDPVPSLLLVGTVGVKRIFPPL